MADITSSESFKFFWMKEMYQKLKGNAALKGVSGKTIQEVLEKVYEERKVSEARLFNNHTNDLFKTNQENIINRYLNTADSQILSGYGCFFKNQDEAINISSAALENLGNMRKVYKKKMEAAPHGSDEYTYYRILQLTYKVLMNSYYGILGEKNSTFYNPFVQNSITMSGQDLITTSIIAMENFLSNNVPFFDTEDAITFITNVRLEKPKFNILDYVDHEISSLELLDYLCSHTENDSEINRDLISGYVENMTPEIRTRCYYKNQIRELIKNSWFQNKLQEMIKYKYLENPDPEMVDGLEEFKEKVLDFSFYNYLIEDRYRRACLGTRKSVITIDTDSNFINLNPLVSYVTKNFNLNKKDEEQQMTVMNIFINIVTVALEKTFWLLTGNMHIPEKARTLVNMKNESKNRQAPLYREIYRITSLNAGIERNLQRIKNVQRLTVMNVAV